VVADAGICTDVSVSLSRADPPCNGRVGIAGRNEWRWLGSLARKHPRTHVRLNLSGKVRNSNRGSA